MIHERVDATAKSSVDSNGFAIQTRHVGGGGQPGCVRQPRHKQTTPTGDRALLGGEACKLLMNTQMRPQLAPSSIAHCEYFVIPDWLQAPFRKRCKLPMSTA